MENYLENAKAAIDGYFMKEFGELNPTRYDDLERVGLAYTMLGENEDREVQAYADLVNCKFTQYVDGRLIHVEDYKSLENMTELLLRWMSFDDLVWVDPEDLFGVPKSAVEKYVIVRDGKEIELTHDEVYTIFRKKEKEYYAEDLTARYNIPDDEVGKVVERFDHVLGNSDAYYEAFWDAVDYTCEELGYEAKEEY